MVEVLALRDEEGGDLLRTARPPLERLLPQEQAAPPLEQDTLDVTIVDLRAPLNLTIDLVKAAEALEQTRIALFGKAAGIKDNRRRMSSTLREFYAVQGFALAGEARGRDTTTAPLLWVQAGLRRSRHHRPTKAKRSTAGATALQAGAVEVTVPSGLAAMVGTVETQLPQLGQLRPPAGSHSCEPAGSSHQPVARLQGGAHQELQWLENEWWLLLQACIL
jgi:hypothetical protein